MKDQLINLVWRLFCCNFIHHRKTGECNVKTSSYILLKILIINFICVFCIISPSFAQLDAQWVSDNIPSEMHPGETRRLIVTMNNNGSVTWVNPGFELQSINTPENLWFYPNALLPSTLSVVNPGENVDITLYLQAPDTPGTYDSEWQMEDDSTTTLFGETVVDSIWVDESVTPFWDAALVSHTLPTELYPEEPRFVTITLENTGAGDWFGNRYALGSQNDPALLWAGDTSQNFYFLGDTETVTPTQERTFNFIIVAPAVEDTYDCDWQMYNIGSENIAWGDFVHQAVNVSTSVTPQLGATEASNTIPTDMFPGETRSATITLQNTGTVTWDETNVRLHAPNALWGSNRNYTLAPGETVAQGETKEFTITIKAPSGEGTYDCVWQMQRKWNWGEGDVFGDFGDIVTESVNVNSSVTPFLGAAVVSHTIPPTMTAGEVVSVDVTYENTGTGTWDGSDTTNWIRLRTQNSPSNLWVTQNVNLGVSDLIAPGEQKTFTFNITAPVTDGPYNCRWQLQKQWPGSTSFFGELLDVPVQVGSTTEVCDDGLDNDGDTDIDCEDSDCNGELCDDNDACTTGETCTGSVCGGGSAVDCNDLNVCTDDSCDPIAGCEFTNNTDPCDDGLYCNGDDTCSGGACTHSGDPCTPPDACDEDNDLCGSPVEICDDGIDNDGDSDIDCADADCDAEPCDDGIGCTESDVCSGGICDGTPNGTLCDDVNACTDDVCTAGVGCEYTNNTDPCDDGLYCNGDDTCSGGACTHSGDPCTPPDAG